MIYNVSIDVDGLGNWSITLPADNDQHDVLALGPVIEGVKVFLAPTTANTASLPADPMT